MTTALDSTLSLDDGGDLVAAIPHLLGFHPSESLIVITLVEADELQVGAVFRVDLPPERHRASLAGHLAGLAVTHGAERALAVVVAGSGSPPHSLPHRRLVTDVIRAFAAVTIPMDHTVWVPAIERGATWWCYNHHRCSGKVPDPETSALGVAMLVRGAVKYSSRAELAATLAPDPPEVVDRLAALIDSRAGSSAADRSIVDSALTVFTVPADAEQELYDDVVLDLYHAHTPPPEELPSLPEEELADLAFALYEADVRGYCQTLALTPSAAAAERLWTYLVRSLPTPDRAEPACFLAVSAYMRGNGPLARVALDVALSASPGHHLAGLLTAALDGAMTPLELRDILGQAGEM
ncbi:DUF4192 domain-containing protein [Actinokineospora sp. 24-640]